MSHLPRSTRSAVFVRIPIILSGIVPMDGLHPAGPLSAVLKTGCDVLAADYGIIISALRATILFSWATEAALIVRKSDT